MEQTLNEIERRVLGVMIEKSLSQPEYYPMTANAIVAGGNQKSNRHPVMDIEEVDVLRTLDDLRRRGLTSMVLAAPGARANRYKHETEKALGWNKRQQAIMAELLLRGPQTTGELRSRCARMFKFENLETVTIALESLGQPESGPAMVATLPREPGQSVIRYTHLLYPEGEAPQPLAAVPSPSPSPAHAKPQAAEGPASGSEVEGLRTEINDLNAEIADLHEEVADLRRRLEVIENRTAAL